MRAALELLRAEHPELVDDIADGKRFFWLGSGISKDQVPDLVELVRRVLLFLRDRSQDGEPDAGPHTKALLEILDDFLPAERARYESDRTGWVPGDLESVRSVYSRVLAVGVDGKHNDYLLFEGANLPELYGSPDLQPGPTHFLIALLISEGVVPNLASGNWDGLIEKALSQISGDNTLLDVYVDVDDPRHARGFAEIAKFHGCAVLAGTDPEKYRDKVLATRVQISQLNGDKAFEHMKLHLRSLATNKRSLVLGLSIQDDDLLSVIQNATSTHPWPWDPARPAYVFAEPGVLPSQRDVLEVAYGTDFSRNRADILRRSALGDYAGPMVAAIVLEVLSRKLVSALHRHAALPPDILNELELGIGCLIDGVVRTFGHDEASLIAFILGPYTKLLRTYMGPRISGSSTYVPLVRGTRSHVESGMETIALGIDSWAAAVAAIGHGESSGRWQLSLHAESNIAGFDLSSASHPDKIALVLAKGAREAISIMSSDEWSNEDGEMVLLQAEDGQPTSTRSPAGRIGRGRGRKPRRELAWATLGESVSNVDELLDRFAIGVGL